MDGDTPADAPGNTPVESTGRFTLRSLSPVDADWITEACQDVETQRWTTVPRPYTRAMAEEFIAGGGAGLSTWAIVDADGQGLGMISIHELDDTSGDADVGYWVAPWARRRGVVTWAIGAVVDRVRSMPGAQAVTLQIAATNAASRGAAAKAGFSDDGPNGCTCPDGDERATTHVFRYRLA